MGFLLRVSIVWAAVTVLMIVAFLAGVNLPAHRFLAFFLPLPLLVALGVIAIARPGRAARGSPGPTDGAPHRAHRRGRRRWRS